MAKDCWADADERDAMIAECDRLREALSAERAARRVMREALEDTHAARKSLDDYVWHNCIHNKGEGHASWVVCRACVLAYLRAALAAEPRSVK